jgi:hypothetical protein
VFPQEDPTFKILLVVARPDDESECGAVLYRITHDLGGAVDQVVVTNGEAGGQSRRVFNTPGLGARTAASETELPESFSELDGFPLTRTTSSEPAWTFDSGVARDASAERRTPLKCHHALNYSIVVNWVIAEHKSQGIFQMEYGRRTREYFWLFEIGSPSGVARWRTFLQTVEERLLSWAVREAGFEKAFSA